MYCKKCGKFINSDASVCNECAEEMLRKEQGSTKTEQTYTAKPQTQTVQRGNIMEGFGKALAAAIIPEVAAIVGMIGFVVGASGLHKATGIYSVGAFVMFVSIALCVVAIVFGAKSISLANGLARDGYKRPIATMICGIVGLVSAILVAFMLALYLIILGAMPYMPTGG